MLKRVFDLILVLGTLPIWSCILIVASFAAWFDLKAFPFFFQKRGGKNGEVITIFKLKTMTDEKDEYGNLLDDKYRITRIGNMFRKLSLDELPSLINILKGDMSLIGPRPFLKEYLPLYTKEQNRRHEILPGLTGWAQVNGRNSLSWEERFKLDVWYVDNYSFWLDVKILFKTVKKVLIKDGISADGEVTMSKFTGSKVMENSYEIEGKHE
ncbi:sugar transferase EpsL [Psychrobacter sp. PL15]|uniref:sugar transferase n=1 Tax=Psychrobacter sp. PL15 TaxID=3071719 RepID=UPI002E0797CE|nr:sugar transferase EpsL [Psychrobacter sp. PL15]